MIEYSDRVMKTSRNLRIRFSIVKMRDQCNSKIENFSYTHRPYSDIFEWARLKKDFNYLLDRYDNDGDINEEFVLKLYGIKLNDNIIAITRLIKLMKIT